MLNFISLKFPDLNDTSNCVSYCCGHTFNVQFSAEAGVKISYNLTMRNTDHNTQIRISNLIYTVSSIFMSNLSICSVY